MKGSCVLMLSILVSLSQGHRYTHRNVELPNPRVVVTPADSDNSIQEEMILHKPPNSQLMVGNGEEIGLNSRITLECDAGYPVQFIYTGDGMPEYTTNTSQTNNTRDEAELITKPRVLFEAQLFLGYGRSIGYYDSGRYTCRSLQDASKAVHYYLFVSDGKLFIRPEGDTIYFKRTDPSVRIPCSVTNPKAVVSLQKSVNGLVQCPLNESISFEPTSGFQVKISNRFDPAGTYVCTAGYKGTYQATQYVLLSDGPEQEPSQPESIRQPCRRNSDCSNTEACMGDGHCGSPCSRTCGQNTSCRTVNHSPQCSCLPGYSGDPYNACYKSSSSSPHPQDPCSPYPCGQNTVCENRNGVASCSCSPNYQGDPYYKCYRRSDPCNPNPCGPNSRCVNRNNYASCSCEQGFIGTPPHCRAECESDYHCRQDQVCSRYRCRNPCEGACADIPNTECRVINRRPVCARVQNRCPSGYYGRDCSKIHVKDETIPPPPVKSTAPGEDVQEQISPCVPFPCGLNAECSTQTVKNPVHNETTDVALCQCPPGKTGNADVECFPNEEVVRYIEEIRSDLPVMDEEETERPTSSPEISSAPLSSTFQPSSTTTVESTTTAAAASPKKCGSNAIAIVSADGKSICNCPVGFTGIAAIECHALNEEVDESNLVEPEYCDSDGTNTTIACGSNAYCVIINGTQTCQCIKPFKGDPTLGCELECTTDTDCPAQYACYNSSRRCVDPCEPSLQMFFTQCGRDAYCKVEDHKPVCYCPKDLPYGSPEIHCKEKSWMPNHLPPSPLPTCDKKMDNCGNNAECRAFHDANTYCVCKPGFYGDPYGNNGCQVGIQCRNSTSCTSQKECVNGRCLDPCRNKEDCGPHAGCTSDEHKSKCVCNIGAIRMSPNGPCEPVKGALAERLALYRSFEDFKRK